MGIKPPTLSGPKGPRISIVGGPTGSSTTIHGPDGTPIEGVTSATIYLEPTEVNRVSLDILLPVVEVEGVLEDVTWTGCPCGEPHIIEHQRED